MPEATNIFYGRLLVTGNQRFIVSAHRCSIQHFHELKLSIEPSWSGIITWCKEGPTGSPWFMPGCLNQLFEVAADSQNGHMYKMQITRPTCVEFNYYLLFYACFTGISPDWTLSPGKDYIRLKEIQGESDFVFLCLYNEFRLIPYLNPPPNWEGCSPTSWHGLKVLVSIPSPPRRDCRDL